MEDIGAVFHLLWESLAKSGISSGYCEAVGVDSDRL